MLCVHRRHMLCVHRRNMLCVHRKHILCSQETHAESSRQAPKATIWEKPFFEVEKKKMRSAMTCKTPRLSPRDLSPEARLCKNGFHVYSNKSWGSSWTSLGSLGLHLEISGESLVLPGALSRDPWGLWDCTWRSLGESLGLPGALSGRPWAPWGSSCLLYTSAAADE